MTTSFEYRYAPLTFEVRGAGPEAVGVVSGVVLKYGELASIAPGMSERFLAGAFGDMSKVDAIANVQHDRNRPLARSGGGLVLIDTPSELRAEITLPPTAVGRDAKVLIEQKVLRGLSVEFGEVRDRMIGATRQVESAKLYGLGVVDRPAYPGAQIEAVRALMQEAVALASLKRTVLYRML